MSVSIAWATKVISVPKSYLSLIQASPTEIRELDLDAFRLDLKALEDNEDGIVYDQTHEHTAPVDVGGVTLARVVELINGYTVTFEDGQYAVNISGGNSNVGDNVNVNQVSVRSFNSAGLITSRGIEALEYQMGVWIDTTSDYDGSVYPTGTLRQPVNNIDDAKMIASANGFDSLFIIGDITIADGDDIDGFKVIGREPQHTTITLQSGCSTDGTVFKEATVTGTLDGDTWVTHCIVNDLTYVQGQIENCILTGTITLAGSDVTRIVNCTDGQANGVVPTISVGSGRNFLLAKYTGDVKLADFTGSSNFVSIDLLSGKVWIDSSCTAGYIFLRGVGTLSDSGSSTIYNELLSLSEITDAVWDEALAGHTIAGTIGELLTMLDRVHINKFIWDSANDRFKLYNQSDSLVGYLNTSVAADGTLQRSGRVELL
jgi:hypothetical protein